MLVVSLFPTFERSISYIDDPVDYYPIKLGSFIGVSGASDIRCTTRASTCRQGCYSDDASAVVAIEAMGITLGFSALSASNIKHG